MHAVPEPGACRRRKGPSKVRGPRGSGLHLRGEAPEELRHRQNRSTWVEALSGCDNAGDAPPSFLLQQARRDLQRIPPRAAPASAYCPDGRTDDVQEPEAPEPARAASRCSPRARASYRTLKRRAARSLSETLKGTTWKWPHAATELSCSSVSSRLNLASRGRARPLRGM